MLNRKKILMIGAGGLTNASLPILLQPEIEQITIIDEDLVELSNLHRQPFFSESNVGQTKVSVLQDHPKLLADCKSLGIKLNVKTENFNPLNAKKMVQDHDIVVDGSDNYPTKFLIADVCFLEEKVAIFAGCTGWNGWSLLTIPNQTACFRCVFENIPTQRAANCSEAGVLGSVVGVVGAIEANLVMQYCCQSSSEYENAPLLWNYEGLKGKLRSTHPKRRPDCTLCAEKKMRTIRMENYLPS